MDINEGTSNVYRRAGLIILTLCTAGIALAISINYRQLPILEFYGFRQTQTAISSYWMLHEGWQLAYQTPVGGYPWSIPFEFPIYQSIVAFVVSIGGFPLDPVGRFVSLFFLFACGAPAFGIARRLRLPPEVPWVFTALLWSSPLYLFWGRTFMIETAATFFTFAAIPYAIDLIDEMPTWRSTLLFLFWITLGLLQKITTALPVVIVFSLLIVITHFKTLGLRMPPWQKIIRILFAFAVPMIISGLWSYYSDIVRGQNLIGREMISKSLVIWNFGTLQQRLDLKLFLEVIWNRVCVKNLGAMVGPIIIGLAFWLGDRRIRSVLLVSLILFLLPIEIFFNVHVIHDYYQVASCLFIIGGLSIAIVDLSMRTRWNGSFILLIVAVSFVVLNLYVFKLSYGVLLDTLRSSVNKSTNKTLLLSSILQKYTSPDSVIVIYGMEWNSEIPYYAERKSLMVPLWLGRPDWPGELDWQRKYGEVWKNPEPYLGGLPVSAMVFCNQEGSHYEIKEVLNNPFVQRRPSLFDVLGCYLWLPATDKILVPGTNEIILPRDY